MQYYKKEGHPFKSNPSFEIRVGEKCNFVCLYRSPGQVQLKPL